MTMKCVLQVTGSMNLGGAETYVMNLYRYLRKNNDIQFNFAVYGNSKQYFEDEIISLGGKIFHLSQMNLKQ